VFNVPERNRNFTGRREALEQLRTTLVAGASAAVTALHGLGGVGKTELAIEYAWRYHTDYSHIWWVRAETPTTLVSDFASLARKLPDAVRDGVPDADAAAAARAGCWCWTTRPARRNWATICPLPPRATPS
jgi:hypothetical protein